MITAADELQLHQVAETFDNTPVSDHRFFDRIWMGVQAPDGKIALITGMGVYKNMNVMDGFVCIQKDAARQFNHRFSRALRPNVGERRLGPLSIDVIEPLKRLRIRLAPGDYACSCDIEWAAVLPPHEEPKHRKIEHGRPAADFIRFDQFAKASGWIEIEGERTEFQDWFASRDHSWGVRPGVGGYEPVNADPNPAAGHMGLYCWFLTDEVGGLLQLQEDADGNRLYLDGHIDFRDAPGERALRVVDIQHDLKLFPGTRIFQSGTIVATAADGQTFTIEAKNTGRPWLYKGSGYDSGYLDERGLGVWRGPWLEEYDEYDISDAEAAVLPDGRVIRPRHREQLAQVTVNGKPGNAHLPFITSGRISRYGLGL